MDLREQIIAKLKSKEVMDELKSRQIKHLWLFGSFAKGNWTQDSDVDLLYESDDNKPYKDWGIFGTKLFLDEYIYKYCDLVSIDNIHEKIKSNILSTKLSLW